MVVEINPLMIAVLAGAIITGFLYFSSILGVFPNLRKNDIGQISTKANSFGSQHYIEYAGGDEGRDYFKGLIVSETPIMGTVTKLYKINLITPTKSSLNLYIPPEDLKIVAAGVGGDTIYYTKVDLRGTKSFTWSSYVVNLNQNLFIETNARMDAQNQQRADKLLGTVSLANKAQAGSSKELGDVTRGL